MSTGQHDDEAFDAAIRTTLRSLPVPDPASVHLPRRNFLRAGIAAAAGLITLGAGGAVSLSYAETPRFVRAAFAHTAEESALRGVLVPDLPDALAALDLPPDKSLPGVLQLCKSCEVDGYPAWHLMVFLDKLGYVDIFAFRSQLPLHGQGHWLRGQWTILSERRAYPLLVISKNAEAMSAVLRPLQAEA